MKKDEKSVSYSCRWRIGLYKYLSKSFLYTFFFERRRNPAFSFIRNASSEKKAGFLPRTDIKNL
ncbi:Uncharacterized protein dnm_084060 [Desulfonema magnum]|uniref:Uncharacterized protein n=1 Tax=Desulfonema magnum TaxID=45655 RepID=A0A975BW12_9BACT|nr:Uncharacterized protein dnm_084060 [Desulfonema magnum]